MTADGAPNGAVPVTVLAERYPCASDFVFDVERKYPGGVRRTADPGTQVATCLACESKGHYDPTKRFPLVVRSGPEGGWRLARTCGCPEGRILAALGEHDLAEDAPAAALPSLPFASAADLRRLTPEEPEWVWRNYFARGAVSIVAGRAKVGKSTLVCAVLEAVVSGAPDFLGCPVAPGPAIYVSEESAGTLAEKLPASDRLRVLTRGAAFPRPPWREIVSGSAEEASRVGAALIVIDTFSFWGQLPAERENDAGATQQAMAPLLEIAASGLAVVVVHHQRKAGGEDGVAIRGSSGLAASADALIEVERALDRAPGQRRLLAISRWSQSPPELVADRDPATGAWLAVGERQRPAERRDEACELALAILREAGEDLSRAEVARRLGRTKSDGTVKRALERLERDGLALRTAHGWGCPAPGVATLPGLDAPKPLPERDSGVATSPDGHGGYPATSRRSQEGVHPFRGGPLTATPLATPDGESEQERPDEDEQEKQR